MVLRWIIAALHLLGLGIGLGAIWARGRALRGELGPDGLRRVFYADTLWGVAALLWISTGLARVCRGRERQRRLYLQNTAGARCPCGCAAH
jgi:putative membrane protein